MSAREQEKEKGLWFWFLGFVWICMDLYEFEID